MDADFTEIAAPGNGDQLVERSIDGGETWVVIATLSPRARFFRDYEAPAIDGVRYRLVPATR